jgi:hypothetical protein
MVAAKREMSDDAGGPKAKKPKKEEKKVESDDEVLPNTPATQKSQRPIIVIPVSPGARTVKLATPIDDDRSFTIGSDLFDWQFLDDWDLRV